MMRDAQWSRRVPGPYHGNNDFAPACAGAKSSSRYFFSTFQMKVTGEMMTPDRLVRYAVGMMNCAVGT